MPYIPPAPDATLPGQPTPDGVAKQDVHIVDLPPEIRKSFLLSMVFFPTLVGATICVILFLGWWTFAKPKDSNQYALALTSADSRHRWEAARELAENIGNPAIYDSKMLTVLIEILQNSELDKEAEKWSPSSMIRPDDEQKSHLRWWAAGMVGHFGSVLPAQTDKDRAREALIRALEDKDLAICAASGLSLLNDPLARVSLVHQLETNDDPAVQSAAAFALGSIGRYSMTRGAAAEAEVDSFRQPLLSIYNSSHDAYVLDNTAIALARLKDPSGKERLLKMEKNEDADIRDLARRALGILDSTIQTNSSASTGSK